jgi:acetylornithine deacetylase
MGIHEAVTDWVEKHRQRIVSTVSDLVRIRTENIPPGGNEKPGQELLRDRVSSFIPAGDIDMFEIDDVPGIRGHPLFFSTIDGKERVYAGRPNLVARLRGTGGGRSLVFSGHMDTMPVYGKQWSVFPDPFSGAVKDGRLYGRGSVDMKAGTAAGFLALECLRSLGVRLRGDVLAESVIDEENGGVNGTLAARLRNPQVDFAILAEPSGLTVGVETIGGTDWKATATVSGPGGIGAGLELPNPIYALSRVALALEKYDERLGALTPPEAYPRDTKIRLLTYQLSSGGSTYADSGAVPTGGHLIFWQEAYAGTGEGQARKELLDFLTAELGEDPRAPGSSLKVEPLIRFLEGHRTDRGHPALGSIRDAFGRLGLPWAEKGVPFAMDAFAFRRASRTEVAVVGPTGQNPHGIDEYVEVESILALVKIMVFTAIDFCA